MEVNLPFKLVLTLTDDHYISNYGLFFKSLKMSSGQLSRGNSWN